MPTMYFESDVNAKALDGKCVAMIGYGSQGRGQSLNPVSYTHLTLPTIYSV